MRGRKASLTMGVAGALVLAWIALAGASMAYYPVGIFNDDARFVLRGYQMLGWEPSAPNDEVGFYSPGHGALLAVGLLCVGPEGYATLRWMSVACMVVSAVFLALLVRRWVGDAGAVAAAACFLYNFTAVTLGSTLLADPPWLVLSLGALLLARHDLPSRPWLAYGVGLLAGVGVLFRPEGWVVPGALGVWLLASRNSAVLSRFAMGVLVPAAVSLTLTRQAHLTQVSQFGDGWIMANTRSFLSGLPALLGTGYLGLPPKVAPYAGGAVLLLAFAGAVRARRDLFDPLFLVGAGIVAVQFVWPYPDARYLMLIWFLLIVLGALALPRPAIAAPVLATLVMLAGAPALVDVARVSAERAGVTGRWDAYAWVRENVASDARFMSLYAVRVRLLARRMCVQPASADLWGELLADACDAGATYLFWEPGFALRSDFRGERQVHMPSRPDLWMDASTLVERVFSTPWDRVYRLKVAPATYLRAWRLYLRATRLDWSRERSRAEMHVREALRLVPDMPEARTMLALLLLDSERHRAEAVQLLTEVVNQYRVDVGAAYNLGLALLQGGQTARAVEVLRQGRETAIELGRQDLVGQFDAILTALAENAGAKGH